MYSTLLPESSQALGTVLGPQDTAVNQMGSWVDSRSCFRARILEKKYRMLRKFVRDLCAGARLISSVWF